MEGDCAMEGTIGALLHAQPVDTSPEERKRSGRPCVGGKGELWDAITHLMMFETDCRTKNGLPGVPYAMKHTMAALREVWTRYAPGVKLGVPPLDCVWIASAADAMIPAISTDVYLSLSDALRFLQALADVSAVLCRRTSEEWITDAHAPRAMFTPAVTAKYAAAIASARPSALHPTPSQKQHFICWADVERLYGTVESMLANAVEHKLGPDAIRTLGWGRFVLALFMPFPGPDNGAPLHVTFGMDVLNHLHVWKQTRASAAGMEVEPAPGTEEPADVAPASVTVPFLYCDVPRGEAYLELPSQLGRPVARVQLQGKIAEAALWVWLQRESAIHRERLFPKRVTTDIVLKRLCKQLQPYVHARTLTAMGLHTSWVTHAFAEVMDLLDVKVRALQLGGCDILPVLQTAVYPSTISSIPRLCFPGDAVNVATLFVDA